jgi:AbrB family transcriptional regulator (stage V sporulation protein T)
MKATGIVRRIDDLGRVVIPKEIRKQARISEGDALEIFLSDDGAVCFKPYEEKPLTNEEILERFDEMSREEKAELIKKMIENL